MLLLYITYLLVLDNLLYGVRHDTQCIMSLIKTFTLTPFVFRMLFTGCTQYPVLKDIVLPL